MDNEYKDFCTYYIKKFITVVRSSSPDKQDKPAQMSMFHPKIWDKWGEPDTVRIYIDIGDDRAFYRDFKEWGLLSNWNWCKEHFFDRIPQVVSEEWLFEHGYVRYN